MTPPTLGPTTRFALYLLGILGGIVVAYLTARGVLGDAETAAWVSVAALLNLLSAANVQRGKHAAEE